MNEIENLRKKQEELKRGLEELEIQINELEKKEITKSGKRWRGAKDRFYWYIESDCKVYGEYEKDDDYDNARYEIGNYFRTEEEAKKIVKKLKQKYKAEHIHAIIPNIDIKIILELVKENDLGGE